MIMFLLIEYEVLLEERFLTNLQFISTLINGINRD